MTTKQNDGGAALARGASEHSHGQYGLSARDYFATEAMGSLIVLEGHSERIEAIEIAKYAYLMADAMLAAREAK